MSDSTKEPLPLSYRGVPPEKLNRVAEGWGSRFKRMIAPLAAAAICTLVIVRAIMAVVGGRANGDIMVTVCPILGAVFLSIPAGQAWWACFKILRGK